MNKVIVFVSFCLSMLLVNVDVIAQYESVNLLRSTTSNAGSSVLIDNGDNKYLIQHSIGQSSPSGLAEQEGFVARQGFIQPYLLARLAENPEPLGFDIYPNPTLGDLYIDLEESYQDDLKVRLYDYRGRLIYRNNFRNQQTIKLDLRDIAQGSYFLRVIVDGKQRVVQINKQR